MAGNSVLTAVTDHGMLQGFGNLFQRENRQWWRTWQWVIQILIWLVIVDGMVAMVAVAAPRIEAAQARQEMEAPQAAVLAETVAETALLVFFVFSGMAPAVGVVILGQEAIIEEKRAGTAAWVLSKPVSRAAFILSKLTADALGVLVTMVVVPGAAAYLILRLGAGMALAVSNFVAALALVYLLLLFYLSLTVMLGTLFASRGPVVGIPLVVVFGNQLAGLLPWLGKVMPWNLVMDLGPAQPALATSLAQGRPLPTIVPLIGTAVLTCVFVVVALWRFERESF